MLIESKFQNKQFIIKIFLAALIPFTNPLAEPSSALDVAIANRNWDQVTQISQDLLQNDSTSLKAKISGFTALKQKNYPLSSLFFLRKTDPAQWESSAEIESLKKIWTEYVRTVPESILLNILPQSEKSLDSLWARAISSYRKKDYIRSKDALSNLMQSAYEDRARQLLGVIQVIEKNMNAAKDSFALLCKKDNSRQESACLNRARLDYASKNNDEALKNYEKISSTSPLYNRAQIEKSWLMLRLGKLEAVRTPPGSIDQKILEIALLIQQNKNKAAKDSLKKMNQEILANSSLLANAVKHTNEKNFIIPQTVKSALEKKEEWKKNNKYLLDLTEEYTRMKSAPLPAYKNITKITEIWLSEIKQRQNQLLTETINNTLSYFNDLLVNISISYADLQIEDNSASKQTRLDSALHTIDSTRDKLSKTYPELELRQAELLWELGSQPDPQDQDRSTLMKAKALETAEALVQNYSNFEKRPRSLFFTGYIEVESGLTDKGLKTLTQYITKYPKEKNMPDAYRILADQAFSIGKYSEAENLYRKSLNYNKWPHEGYVRDRLAWCFYYLGKFEKAMNELEAVLKWTDQWEKSPEVLEIEKAAKRDLVTIFSEMGDSNKATTYFQRLLKEESTEWILALGKELERTGENEKAVALYRTLINKEPSSPDNIIYQLQIVWAIAQTKNWEKTNIEIIKLVDQAKGTTTSSNDPMAIEIEKKLSIVAQEASKALSASGSQTDVSIALQINQKYLSLFRDWKNAQNAMIETASLLLKQKHFEDAKLILTESWNRFNAAMEPTNRELLLRQLIGCLKEIESKNKNTDKLSTNAAQLIALVEEYEKSYPNARYIREISFLGSSLFFKYAEIKKGITASQKVFDSNPRDEFAKKAFDNLRVAYYNLKDWEATYQWANEMSHRKEPGMENFVDPLITIRAESLFMLADTSVDPRKATDLYLKIADDSDLKEYWEKSLYNAFIKLLQLTDKREALKTASRLDDLAPESELVRNISLSRGSLLFEVGDYESSAAFLSEALQYPPKDVTKDTILNTELKLALVMEATNKKSQAVQLFTDYLNNKNKLSVGTTEANLALNRLGKGRTPTSQTNRWQKISDKISAFEKALAPTSEPIEDQIKLTNKKLEALLLECMSVSTDSAQSTSNALEAFCAMGSLYHSYEVEIEKLGVLASGTLQDELAKIASTMSLKSKDLMEQCIAKSSEADHDGKYYRKANVRWGPEFDPILTERIKELVQNLEKKYPALDAPYSDKDITNIIELHLSGKESAESWFTLARARCVDPKNEALCRLTLSQALGKYPFFGPLLNASAILEQTIPTGAKISDLFIRAANSGSKTAYANLAVFHLKGGRFKLGIQALRSAASDNEFNQEPQIKEAVKEWLK